MLEDVNVYLKANEPFWFHLNVDKSKEASLVRISFDASRSLGLGEVSGKELHAWGLNVDEASMYDLFLEKDVIVLNKRNKTLSNMFRDSAPKEFFRAYGTSIAQQFRSKTKTQLIEKLSHQECEITTDAILKAFLEYTFFDGYSAWLFNEQTATLTKIAGNYSSPVDYLDVEKVPILKNSLASDKMVTCEVSEKINLPDNVDSSIKWVNALRVETSSSPLETKALKLIVCLYTKHIGYNLREKTCRLVRSHLQQNLAFQYFDRMTRLNLIRERQWESLSLEDPSQFLNMIVKSVTEDLKWEICSIFLLDQKNIMKLQLAALWPKVPNVLKKAPEYSMTDRSMTSHVCRENKMLWSYDIENDPRNSHKFDEPSLTKRKDWIGVPIVAPCTGPIGVLRVLNRTNGSGADKIHFCSLDMQNLQAVAGDIASFLHRSHMFTERQKLAEERAKELSALEDFLRTFRHEIRSPIQAICFAPERIALIFKEEGLFTHENLPKKLQEYLFDFKATGERLEMISKALTLSPEEIVKEISRHSLFKDGLAPVLAFCTPFALKKDRRIIVDKDSLLVNMNFDAAALTIAFHVLIDNAIKYSDKGTIIRVYGERVAGGHQVVVENYTSMFEISEEEATKITVKYFRGKKAREQIRDGCGIGLFLAKRIMELQLGDLVIIRRSSPIRFGLKLRN